MIEKHHQGHHESSCLICAERGIIVFLEISGVPVHCNLIMRNRQDALNVERESINLGFCWRCGHIFNADFTPSRVLYHEEYENSLHFSHRFQDYAVSIAKHLIERYGIRHKEIIEIGCGRGEFLEILCSLGSNRGIGFDPSFIGAFHENGSEKPYRIIRDYYSPSYSHLQADLVCCRHVLEHLPDPLGFLHSVHGNADPEKSTILFLEVPYASFIFAEMAVWDIIYEHCSYFTKSSLSHLLNICNFSIVALTETYEGQFLCAESYFRSDKELIKMPAEEVKEVSRMIKGFAVQYRSKLADWRNRLEEMLARGRKVILWGAGSKAVTFLNVLNVKDEVPYVVDINPRKQGNFIPGTGQQIISPAALESVSPDVVIVMNPIYLNEIRKDLAELGLRPELYAA